MATTPSAHAHADRAGDMNRPGQVIEIQLEELGAHSGKGAVLGAILGAGGGPVYRFVAVGSDSSHAEADHAAVGVEFPLKPFQDLNEETDDEWIVSARRRLEELDTEIQRAGWRRLPDRGQHWWSLRYQG